MAKIEDLIAQIPDERLRKAVAGEVKALKKTKKFGLVFEEHLPETVRLPRLPVREGELVALKRQSGNQLWRVKSIRKDIAICEKEVETFPPLREPARSFRSRISLWFAILAIPYIPRLSLWIEYSVVDRVNHGTCSLMQTTFMRFSSCSTVTRARWTSSTLTRPITPERATGSTTTTMWTRPTPFGTRKWLSMMKKRLRLAKQLLKPDGVLVVTIDEHEVHHLGNLLEDELREYARQMVTIVINQKGVAQGRLSRVEEHAFFCFAPGAVIPAQNDDLLAPDREDQKRFQTPRWEWLLRGGTNSRRQDRKQLFFPVYVDPKVPAITGFGEPLPFSEIPKITVESGKKIAWPVRTDGSFGNWRVSPPTLRDYLKKGYVKLGGYDPARKTWTILYLGRKAQKQIESGAIKIAGRNTQTGAVELEFTEGEQRQIKTVWHRGVHDSGNYGSTLLRNILGEGGLFAFPKSLYAVRDTLRIVAGHRPNALILDFFGGSGTTLHATALLNTEIGGNRRCILVTNNEVTDKLESRLAGEGHFQGDPGFERHGVADSVAWPRCKFVLTGKERRWFRATWAGSKWA